MPKNQKINVVKEEDQPIAAEVMEAAIVAIADSMRAINKSRLTRRAIVALIKDNSGIPKSTIEVVLNNLDELEKNYLKK